MKRVVTTLVAFLLLTSNADAQVSLDGLGLAYRDTSGWTTRTGFRLNLMNMSHLSSYPKNYYYSDFTNFSFWWSFYLQGEKKYTENTGLGFKVEAGDSENFYRYDKNTQNYLNQAYLYYQGSIVRFEFGRTINMYRKIGVAAPQVGLPYYSNDMGFVSRPSKAFAMVERVLPDSDLNADKISFLTARYHGVQVGATYNFGSYSFNGEDLTHDQAFKRSYLGLIKYSGVLGPTKIATSYAYQNTDFGLYTAGGERSAQKEHAFGVNVEYIGITFGAGYRKIIAGGTNNNHNLEYDALLLKPDSYTYNLGVAYSIAGIRASLTYSASFADEGKVSDKTDNYALGLEYIPSKNYKVWGSLGYTYMSNREPLLLLKERGLWMAVGVTVGRF